MEFEGYNFSMTETKVARLLLLCLSLCLVSVAGTLPTCPVASSSYALIVHDHLTISTSGQIAIVQGQDALCYSYALSQAFQEKPGVAVAVRQMQAQPSYDLFFSVRATKVESLTSIDFLVRTQWKYTQWTQIEVNFIAENLPQLEANSYNVDTSSLVGCGLDKEVKVMLPFKTPGFSAVKAYTFIHGFEMTSVQQTALNTPYEVQIINVTIAATGVALSITKVSNTQIYTIYISLFAYSSSQDIVAGLYEYNLFVPQNSLSAQIGVFTPEPWTIDFYGLSGFIIPNNGSAFSWRASLSGSTFSFTTSSFFNYLTFNYIFINYNPCLSCQGYSYFYNGQCYNTCPNGTIFNKVCVPSNPTCTGGRIWNPRKNKCVCPGSSRWDGQSCVTCTGGRVWVNRLKRCECPQNQFWNGQSCVSTPACLPPRFLNTTTGQCQCQPGFFGLNCLPCDGGRIIVGDRCICPSGYSWNGTNCTIQCPPTQIFNPATNQCECPPGQNWNGQICITCPPGQIWNPTLRRCNVFDCAPPRTFNPLNFQCECPTNQYWNGQTCITCLPSQVWNPTNLVCQCPPNTFWNGSDCLPIPQCPPPRVYNNLTNQCECLPNYYWNGQTCINCPPGQVWCPTDNKCKCPPGSYWNGSDCYTPPQCLPPRNFNPMTLKCECPASHYWNGQTCVFCTNGKVWCPTNLVCKCPPGTYWNGSYCTNQPQCPPPRVYNALTNQCECPTGHFWNGQTCITCPPGQVWCPTDNKCKCPPGSFWTGNSCVRCQPGQHFNGQICVTCHHGQIWNPTTRVCHCQPGYHYNGYSCIQCPSGQVWNSTTKQCSCPFNQNWNGFSCITCTGGRVWNPSVNDCQCPSSYYWNGFSCINCPSNEYWNGFICVACVGGKVWNPVIMACECTAGTQWNGTRCITPCPTGQISVNGICQCPPGTYLVNGRCRNQPQCPDGQYWFNGRCSPISCPPGTYWDGNTCKHNVPCVCPAGTFFDGQTCSAITRHCPPGMAWNGHCCITNTTQCQDGYYWSGNRCEPIHSRCPPGLQWINGTCRPTGSVCPSGSYFNGNTCIPFTPCTGGRVWNAQLAQCICPANSFWNGQLCHVCAYGQVYGGHRGCYCPDGTFFINNRCVTYPQNNCSTIDNTRWYNGQCVCLPGYISSGSSCFCDGLSTNHICDPCYSKPNSRWVNGICQCVSGYYERNGQCLPITPNPNPPSVPNCNVATYFDDMQKECLPCSDGCLSCISCYTCTQCRPEYYYKAQTERCEEICGDGLRFSLPCDDGNNQDGDGCSSDCQIETGSHCIGGSPNSPDVCSRFKPTSISLTQSGQSHLPGKIMLNVRLNYLPQELIDSATDCKNHCDSVLDIKIVSGFKSVVSIKASYLPKSTYSFSVEFDFGREPIGLFKAQVRLDQGIALKYYPGIDTSAVLYVDVNPAFMSMYKGGDEASGDLLA